MKISYQRITKGERNGKHPETKNDIWRYCGWVIERTFSWLGQNRRLSKDYEQHCESEEAWIYIAMTRLLVKRLAAA